MEIKPIINNDDDDDVKYAPGPARLFVCVCHSLPGAARLGPRPSSLKRQQRTVAEVGEARASTTEAMFGEKYLPEPLACSSSNNDVGCYCQLCAVVVIVVTC